MSRIITDYAEYHGILVIAGGLFMLILIALSVVFWTKFRKIPRIGKSKWRFEKKVYFSFSLLSGLVALLMALIVMVNAITALNPLQGFSLLIDDLKPSGYSAQLDQAYDGWIQSGSLTPPPLIEQRIRQRVRFHSTKAIVCGVLLIGLTALNIRLWGVLIKQRNASEAKWRPRERVFFVGGMGAIALSLLMMIMVVANLQGAIAPIALTLGFG